MQVPQMRLTTASYLVLGLVEMSEPVTPYELKAIAAQSVVNFWSLPHTQIYTQCDRLTEAGYLREDREDSGRRRRSFSITDTGRTALKAWLADAEYRPAEIRDNALLKLFFGADPRALAVEQLAEHEAMLARYEGYEAAAKAAAESGQEGLAGDGPRYTLEIGVAYERHMVEFWRRFVD